jgi:hypothetical protein
MSPSRLAQPAPRRTLLLAPPALSAHPAALAAALAAHDAGATDMEMLDRVAAGRAALPAGAYDAVAILGAPDEAAPPRLGRAVVATVAAALAPDGRVVVVAAGGAAAGLARADRTEGILAGLLVGEDGALVKPRPQESVALLRRDAAVKPVVAGVGFVDFGNGHEVVTGEEDEDDDDELVDEDDLLTEEDRTFVQRESRPSPSATLDISDRD